MANLMQDMQLQRAVEQAFGAAGLRHWQALGQGMGGERWRVTGPDSACFVKTGETDVLAAEADGLAALAATGTVRVPRTLVHGGDRDAGWLALEWLELRPGTGASAARLGEALARLHLMPQLRFGWPRANFIGATPQFNVASDDWPAFFREQRLGFQLRLAAENDHRGALQERGAELMAALPRLFAGHTPKPSLLHGDLWGGNWGALPDGVPVLFDPAVYCGDREVDIAMTELFGGFPAEFQAAYRMHVPLDAGYAARRHLYNLYHVLNHLNLFGEGYLAQAESLMRLLLAEIR